MTALTPSAAQSRERTVLVAEEDEAARLFLAVIWGG